MSATNTCKCQIGASGVEGQGSKLEYVDNPQVTCDRETKKSFAQGHDARLSSRLATEVADGLIDLDTAVTLVEKAGGSETLVSKMTRSAELRAAKAQSKKNKKAEADAPVEDSTDADSASTETSEDNEPELVAAN